MTKYIGILLFILFTSLPLVAQTTDKASIINIRGTVSDAKTKESIPYASIQLLTIDSTHVHAVSTNKDGKFSMSAKSAKYILQISFLGYKNHFQNISPNERNSTVDVGFIYLDENSIILNAAVIEGKTPDIVVKGDTIQYNAGAYKTEDHELLQDLIKKIPGIEIDNEGVIKANGKPITKILVDGKEFFGSDIAYALNNLPANMITKLQLFKEQSEEAKATGVKDQDPPQVLNLVVKEEFKKSMFGDVKAGYGSEDRYISKINANRMYGDNQYSIIANGSNITDGPMRLSGYRGEGINTNKDLGTNFNINPSKKLKINGSIDYSYSKSHDESRNESYTSQLDRYNSGKSNGVNRGENISPKVSLDWKPDSLTTIFIRTDMRVGKDERISFSSDSSFMTGKDATIGYSTGSSNNNSYNFNSSLMIVRRLNKDGRSIRLNLNNRIGKGDEDGQNYSETKYPEGTPPRIIDNISKTDSKNNSYGITVGYVEPFGKEKRFQFTYSFNNSPSERFKDARRKDAAGNYTIIDTIYSRNTKSEYKKHNINISFQSSKEKFDYSVGFNIDPSLSKSYVTLGDSVIEDIKQNVVNFSPNIRFTYKPKESTQFEFYYMGSTRQPDIRQLSADTIVYNGLSKFVGNPNLKLTYDNRINLDFRKSDAETGRFFNISASFNYRFNDVVNYSIIDEKGNSMQTYRNINGNMNAYLYSSYNTPLKNKKFQLSLNINSYYNKQMGFTNEQKSINQSLSFSQSGSLRFNSDKVDANLWAHISQNISFNNLASLKRSTTARYIVYNDFKIKLPLDFSIRNSISYTHLAGYGEGTKNNEFLWNASIEKLFLKKKMGTLQLQLVDILDDRSKEYRLIRGNDYSYSWNNSITSYVMLSFSYRFRITKGRNVKAANNEYEMNEYY